MKLSQAKAKEYDDYIVLDLSAVPAKNIRNLIVDVKGYIDEVISPLFAKCMFGNAVFEYTLLLPTGAMSSRYSVPGFVEKGGKRFLHLYEVEEPTLVLSVNKRTSANLGRLRAYTFRDIVKCYFEHLTNKFPDLTGEVIDASHWFPGRKRRRLYGGSGGGAAPKGKKTGSRGTGSSPKGRKIRGRAKN